MALYRKGVTSSLGRFVIEANDAGISRIVFPEQAARLPDSAIFSAELEKAAGELQKYFEARVYDFSNIELDFSEQSDFEEKILRALFFKKRGLISYAALAELAGAPRSSRAVGNAMNKNPFPVLIPCHHVIRSDGTLGQYAFGAGWKKKLLAHEGIECPSAESATAAPAYLL